MITYKTTNIFRENVQAIVNPVNCVGVMGKGLALAFKKKYLNNYKAYKIACLNNNIKIGKMFVYEMYRLCPQYIINLPTKQHWKDSSKLEYIESGLKDLVLIIKDCNIKSIAIPALGCGCGGLDWSTVKQVIEKYLSSLKDINIIVIEPKT